MQKKVLHEWCDVLITMRIYLLFKELKITWFFWYTTGNREKGLATERHKITFCVKNLYEKI